MAKQRVMLLATLTITNHGNRLLLGEMHSAKRSADGSPNPLGIPAGTMKKGETTIETAVREFFEETGIRLPRERFRFKGSVLMPNKDIFHVYSVVLRQEEKPSSIPPHPEFPKGFGWYEIDNLPWNRMLPEHPQWIPQMLKHDNDDKPLTIPINLESAA